MYQKSISSLGSKEIISLTHNESGNSFSIVPEFGAILLDIKMEGHSLLDGYTSEKELLENKRFKNILLAPFTNRLKDGKYSFEGKEYQFPINNPETGNALHGFVFDKKFKINNVKCVPDTGTISAIYKYQGDFNYYPFPFVMMVNYTQTISNQFFVQMVIKNEGTTNMPVGLGWHPYFQMGDQVNNVGMKLQQGMEMIEVDGRGIPSGKKSPFDYFTKPHYVGDVNLDNGFSIPTPESKAWAEVLLQSKIGTLRYSQIAGPNQYNYLQIYIPPDRKSIALEPMTCNIDAFNNGDGLITLAPGEGLRTMCGFEFFPGLVG